MSRPAEAPADPYDGKKAGPYWHEQLDHAKQKFKTWEDRAEKVVKRYRDERNANDNRSKFNILWSNVQVLKPSLYGRPAKPEVSRRYMDSDPVGRLASSILERTLEFETLQFPDFNEAMTSCVEDRLLPGRGTVWIRFEPTMQQEPDQQITNDEEAQPEPTERIVEAHAPVDYVYWKDFLHSPARTWNEVWWVARAVYMTREEGTDRFGKVYQNVPLSEYKEDNSKTTKDQGQGKTFAQKGKVYEIWNKRTSSVCWVAEGYPEALDERPDPLGLDEFFPCPKPLFATTTNGSLIPVPDYCEYEDQARELDSITGRIDKLVKAVKAAGVFNAEFKELARLLTEGQDNKLFPVTNWMALAEKGGLKGSVEMLDFSIVLQAIGALYTAREQVKQAIYEISGISDIIRGSTSPEETLGAQQLKAQFGSMRLRESQNDVARFASDVFRLKAQIMAKYYPAPLLIEMSDIQQTTDGKNPQLLQQALQMLTNANIRSFHIAIESDSLAQIDEQAEKQAATEAITAIGGFLKESIPMVGQAPETLPMASEMLLFLVRRFRAGRGLESAIEQAMKALQQKAAQAAQNPQPTKEQMQAQSDAQAAQLRAQVETQAAQQKSQFDMQVQQGKLQQEMQLETLKAQQEQSLRKMEGQLKLAIDNNQRQLEWNKALLAAKVDIRTALIAAKAKGAAEAGEVEEEDNTFENLDKPLPVVKPKPPVLVTVHRNPRPMIHHVVRDAQNRIVQVQSVPSEQPTGDEVTATPAAPQGVQ